MPNLRIVTKNALRQAASLTASSTAGNLAVSSLAAAVKSSLHRFTGTNGSYRATWAAPARIGCVALPFCNWSPTAKQRVRVSREKSATNLQPKSEDGTIWQAGGTTPPTVTPVSGANGQSGVRIDFMQGMALNYAGSRAVSGARPFPIQAGTTYAPSLFLSLSRPLTGSESVGIYCAGAFGGPALHVNATNSAAYANGLTRILLPLMTPSLTGSDYFTIYLSGYLTAPLSIFATRLQAEVDKHTSYYPSLDTFTSRASVGTYIGSDGLIKTAAVNEARMQYDPANPLAPAKLLLEPAATNYCKGSETLGGWTGAPGRVTSSLTYKGIPYIEITKVQGTMYEYVRSPSFNRTAGTVQTLTVALRAGTSDKVSIGLYNAASPTWGLPAECNASITSGPGAMYGTDGIRDILGLSKTEDTVVQITRLHTATAADAGVFIYPGRSSSTMVGESVLATRVQVEDAAFVYGPNIVSNGAFDTNTTGWAASASSLSVVEGRLRITGNTSGGAGYAEQNVPTVVGKVYEVSVDMVDGTTVAYLNVGPSSPYLVAGGVSGQKYYFTATGTTTRLLLRLSSGGVGVYADFDNVVLREVTPVPVVTSYIPTTTAAATRAADVYTSAPGVRPDGYIDHWQSYDYDSGWVLACPAPAVELEGFTPAQAASAYAYGGGAYAQHWLPQQMDATGLAVDIADPDNLQGYIEAACLVAGPVWSPKYNASATSVSVIDRTEISRSAAGDQLVDPGTMSRKVPVDLRAMPEADRARFLDLVRNSRAYPILLSVFPEDADLALERDFTVYGRRTKDSDIAYQFLGAYATTLEIEEI